MREGAILEVRPGKRVEGHERWHLGSVDQVGYEEQRETPYWKLDKELKVGRGTIPEMWPRKGMSSGQGDGRKDGKPLVHARHPRLLQASHTGVCLLLSAYPSPTSGFALGIFPP